MHKGRFLLPAALAFLCGAGGSALAQQVDPSDQQLIRMIHQTNQVEMEAGAIAQSNSNSKDVKEYGRTLEQDHKKADQKIIQLAKQQHVQLLMPKTGEEQKATAEELDELRHLKGDAFDRKFLQMMVDGHDKKIEELTKQLGTVKDPQLKALIQGMLPTLVHHRDMAQELLQKKASY